MYEWIRGNIASFLSTASATPHVSVPNRSSAVPVKRSYQSVQTSNDEIEWISVKRQRLGEFVNTVKKSVSGFVTYIRSVAPFGHKVMQVDSKSTKQKKPDQPVKQILSSSLTDISYCGAGESLPRTDLNLDVEHKSKRRHCGNETNWHEFGNIKQRSLSELPGETSEQLPFPLKHHSLPSTPSPLKKNVRSHHCTNIEKNDKERYQLLLRLVAAGLDKKCKQQPSVSASKPAQCVSSNPSQYRHTKAESNDGLNDCENNQIALPTLKLDSASMRLQPSGIESSKNSLTSVKKFHIFVLNGRPITLRVWPRHYTVQPRETAFQHRNRPYGSSVWKNSNTAKSTLVNANVRYKQVSYDDQSEVLQTTRSNPSARMKGRITEQHIECDLSDEVAARLYLDEGNATESVKMPPSQNVKENLSILSKERRADLPQFTERMVEEVKKALDPGEPDEVLSTGFKLRITRRDIGTLRNYSWLNDEIINFYMCLLMERSKDASLPKVYAFSTFFYLKLHTGGYQTVKQWTKGIDLFEKDLILVPVHLGVHWCLTVADLRKKTILHLDSMGQWNDDLCWILLRYLQEESKNKKGRHLDSSEWVLRSMRSNEVPQQMNGSDCGVFVCKYADYIARDEQITFTQHDIPYFRMKMVWEILHKRML